MSVTLRRERVWPALLLMAGASAIVSAVGADIVVGGGQGGVGLMQMLLALAGVGLMVQGASLTSSPGWEHLTALRAWPDSIRLRNAARFVAIAAQLLVIALVATRFRIENPAFYQKIVPLAFYGFVVHHFLPLRYRLHFFVGLSLIGIWSVFGLSNGSWLVAIGLGLIAICHLPVGFGIRAALLVGSGLTLALLRADKLPSLWSPGIWPILGSMFMFRVIAYMYVLRHSKEPVHWGRTLAYFFLLPNVIFPLFPVVDFATFRRTYYDQDAYAIYQRGVQWIFRGISHLLLYRLVYQHLVISQSEVVDAVSLVRYLIANFLLYLRVSGQFHLIVGVLHLFGFRLPETHRFFYLASSFTDFWRRINIYWKDFMQKVIYYPAYFRFKKRGDTFALVVSTLLVFFATWFLHSYQWFWILGKVLLSWTDVLFWTILAVFLIANSLLEAKRGRQRRLGAQRRSWRDAGIRALKTIGTFVVICVLWSLWTSPTVADWFAMWSVAPLTIRQVALIALILLSAIPVAAWFTREEDKNRATQIDFYRTATATLLGVSALYAIAHPRVSSHFSTKPREVIRDLRVAELSKRDADLMQKGYYEELTAVNRFNNQLWEAYAGRAPEFPILERTPAVQWTHDYLKLELRALAGFPYSGGTFRTNRWGMRDQDYEQKKPANTYRMALMGPSHVVGWGVSDNETFEGLVETTLNKNRPGRFAGYELMNFAVPSYSAPQQLMALENKIFAFEPDVVFLVATHIDGRVAATHLAEMIRDGVAVPYDYLREAAKKAGIEANTPDTDAERRLKPYQAEILGETYRRFVALCRQHGVQPVWVFLNLPGDGGSPSDYPARVQQARASGFTVLDLTAIYDGVDLNTVKMSKSDFHPNPNGHRLIAERFHEALLQRKDILPDGPPTHMTATTTGKRSNVGQ